MKIDQAHVAYFSKKYKKGQLTITIVFFCLILILGLGIVAACAILAIGDYVKDLIWLYVVMLVAGALDIYLSIKFIKYSYNKTKYLKPREAAERYIKIHGFQPDDINNIPIPDNK